MANLCPEYVKFMKEEYEKWGLKINMEKTKYMAIGDKSKDLVLEDGQGTIKACNELNEY